MYGHSGAILDTFQIGMEFLTLGEQKGCIQMPNFQNQLVLAISIGENNPITFSKPAPEASPVLTLGKYSKGQVRTITTGAQKKTISGEWV